MNVAKYVANFLIEKNIKHVFGYQGGAILKLLEEFIGTGKIQYVQNYHEQASALAADAYARVNESIGVALATSGPGATNLITGIANAYFDSIPTLFITGQDYITNVAGRQNARQNGFQDLDIVSVVKPVTKYSVSIVDADAIPYELEKAYFYANNGRPGPVLIDIPIDIQFKEINFEVAQSFPAPTSQENKFDISDVISNLLQSKRPVVLLGGGVRISRANEAIREFIQRTQIPVVTTLNGLDLIENAYGFSGLHGHTYANLAIQNADVLFAFGVRFGQRQVGKIPENYTSATVIHVDIDENELGRVFRHEISILADLRDFIQQVNLKLSLLSSIPDFTTWHRKIAEWKNKYHLNVYLNKDGMDPVKAVEKFFQISNEDAIFCNDVGQNQMWVAQGFLMKGSRRLLNSCGLGTMGYSLPAAIGAKIASPDRQVICFTGDGGLQMNLQELIFVGQHGIAIKCVVFNNNTLGMMREVQARYYNHHYYGSCTEDFVCANLEKIADTFGLNYCFVHSLDEIQSYQEFLNDDKPYIFELPISYDSKLSNRYDEKDCFEIESLTTKKLVCRNDDASSIDA